ncbi:MAG: sensor histidine kinase [Candidatus Heteroscillospira sp.]|jgi:signal transduction histidine kinase
MNKIRGSYFLKGIAFILLLASLVVFAVSLLGTVYMYEQPQVALYDNYFQTDSCRRQLYYSAQEIYVRIENDKISLEDLRSYWHHEMSWRGELSFEILDTDGNLLMASYFATPLENAGHIHTLTAENYVIKTYMDRNMAPGLNGINLDKTMFDFVKSYGSMLPPAVFCSFLLAVLSLAFLLAAAGHRRDTEEIVLGPVDRIPLDLCLMAGLTLCVCGIVFAGELSYNLDFTMILPLLALVVLATYIVAYFMGMTVVVRLKRGAFWENTLIWRWGGSLLRWGWKWTKIILRKLWAPCEHLFGGLGDTVQSMFGGLGETIHGLPLIWKAALAAGGVAFMEFLMILIAMETWDFNVLLLMFALAFNVLLVLAVWRLTLDMMKLKKAGERLAAGELEETVDTSKMLWDLQKHGDDLNSIAQGISKAVDKQLKSERMKTELITNVSHDIKTPLTSIVNYVDLLKKEELSGKAAEYVDVLDRQSARLKKLTEDLVEASKASTGNISVNLSPTDVGEIVRQVFGEYTERIDKAKLKLVMNIPDPAPKIMADGRLLWRVIDNLLSNVCKYAQTGTRVYLDVRRHEGRVTLAVKNISREMLNIDPEELSERFVRGDLSRNTEGSGLGLNIARSLTELQNGRFSLSVDGDLFKAELQFNEIG